jgi:hypothetical protein
VEPNRHHMQLARSSDGGEVTQAPAPHEEDFCWCECARGASPIDALC